MSKMFRFAVALLGLMLLAPAMAPAQQAQPAEPAVYTFVAEWGVPRDKWDEFTATLEKNNKPVLERMSANGTLVAWGSFASVVHDDGGITHGTWWASTSLAGIERTREELIKQPNPALAAATKHRDYLLRSIIRNARTTGPAAGYLWVSSAQVKPGLGQDWRAYWEKYSKPTYDELVKNGTIAGYSVDVEQVHTDSSGWRFVVYFAPNADAMDKVNAAFQAVTQKRSPEERRAIGAQLGDMTVAGVHRDFFARITSHWQK